MAEHSPPSADPGPRRNVRLDPVRLCLRAFPPSFRATHEPELARTVHERCHEARARGGRLGELGALLGECADLLVCGVRERLRPAPPPLRPLRRKESPMTAMTGLLGDLRFTLRSLRRRPAFTTAIVATLTLGVGANTALFSVLDAVLSSPLPYPAPDRLVSIWATSSEDPGATIPFSVPDFEDWAARTESLDALGLYSTLPSDQVLATERGADELATAYVSGGFFESLATAALLGRTLQPADEDDPYVVVLSHRAWHQRFGADPGLVGSTVVMEDRPYQVVGVMPASFAFPDPAVEVWVPLGVIPSSSIPIHLRPVRFLSAIGRLAPGSTLELAREELSTVATALAREYPDSNATLDRAVVRSLHEVVVGDVRASLIVLATAVGILLLIGCVNIAHLLLARTAARTPEIQIRGALGAARGRLVRQLLTESLVLAALGGTAGVALAFFLARAVVATAGDLLPRAAEVTVDLRVLLFAGALSLLTGLLFGLVPALRTARRATPGQAGRGSTPRAAGNLLVSLEIAVALVLLVGAGLMVRTLDRLHRVDPGFEPEGLLAVTLTISDSRYEERARYLAFYREALDRLGRLHGVTAIGSIRRLPLGGEGVESVSYRLPDRPEPAPGMEPTARVLQVSPDLFRALGTPLLAGRALAASDREDAPLVAVVNEAFAREAFAGRNPVGRSIEIGGQAVEVVGLVGDIRQTALDRPADPTLYVPQELIPRRGMTFLLRSAGEPLALASEVRAAVLDMDRAQPIQQIASLEQIVSDSVARPRFLTALLAGIALLALVLAAIGAYGVISQQTSRRVAELGIRAALGARRNELMRMVVRQGMAPVLIGLGAGLLVALGVTRWMASLLFEVAPRDPATLIAASSALLVTALCASAIPAWSATRIDPVAALRVE
ncbi:MAG TPA: ABC transporter permease [Thermoanaerobaculia bacterium]|nr:ABC transporter permease [Thermoanaerobaculia bacterium]